MVQAAAVIAFPATDWAVVLSVRVAASGALRVDS